MEEELIHGFSMEQLQGLDRDAIHSVVDGEYIKSKSLSIHGYHTPSPTIPSEFDGIGVRDLRSVGESDAMAVETQRPSTKANIMAKSTPQSQLQTNRGPRQRPASEVMPIAIVGMSCRFPGGTNNLQDMRRLCMEGKSPWSEIPKTRFNADAFYHPNAERVDSVSSVFMETSELSNVWQMNVKSGHFLKEDQYGYFDASFFNISPNEARVGLGIVLLNIQMLTF